MTYSLPPGGGLENNNQRYDWLTGTFWHIWPLLCNHTPAPAPGSWLQWGAQEKVLHRRADVKKARCSRRHIRLAAGQKQLLLKMSKLSHNVTFRQHIAQTQNSHDVIHVAVDTLCHSGILKREIELCFYLSLHCCVIASFFFKYISDLNLHGHLSAALQPP